MSMHVYLACMTEVSWKYIFICDLQKKKTNVVIKTELFSFYIPTICDFV
jgi:hypothetical protein